MLPSVHFKDALPALAVVVVVVVEVFLSYDKVFGVDIMCFSLIYDLRG